MKFHIDIVSIYQFIKFLIAERLINVNRKYDILPMFVGYYKLSYITLYCNIKFHR